MNFFSFMSFAADPSTSAAATQAEQMKPFGVSQIVLLVFFVALFYFMAIRSQKKKEKENEELRASVDVGDEIVTIGGIIGTVVSIKDDFIVLESSGDRNKIRIACWAVQANNTAEERKAKEAEKNKRIKNNIL